jgi:crotonobetainyl-CoA:carnitine CoA-transferase CaiB-like acyl-CoA transferase
VAPLSAIRVVDAASFIAGPLAATMLGDLGADVVKLEFGEGDPLRRVGGSLGEDSSATFAYANRGKRGIRVDPADPEGRAAIAGLVGSADVLFHNQRPDSAARLGLDRAPVVVEITAFGHTGPYADRPALDPIVQAMSGIAAMTGEPDGDPHRAAAPVVDVATAATAAFGALGALREHERTGEPVRVTASLLEVGLMLNCSNFAMASAAGGSLERLGNASHALLADQFAARDGLVWLAVWDDRQWRRLCELLRLGDLAGSERYAGNAARVEHQEELRARLAEAISAWLAEELRAALSAAGIPTAITLGLDEVGRDPHVRATGALRTETRLAGPDLALPAGPLRFDGERPEQERPAPRLGEHTAELLTELGEP